MKNREISDFVRGRIERLETRLATAQETGSISRTMIARLEGRIDSLEEIQALLEGGDEQDEPPMLIPMARSSS